MQYAPPTPIGLTTSNVAMRLAFSGVQDAFSEDAVEVASDCDREQDTYGTTEVEHVSEAPDPFIVSLMGPGYKRTAPSGARTRPTVHAARGAVTVALTMPLCEKVGGALKRRRGDLSSVVVVVPRDVDEWVLAPTVRNGKTMPAMHRVCWTAALGRSLSFGSVHPMTSQAARVAGLARETFAWPCRASLDPVRAMALRTHQLMGACNMYSAMGMQDICMIPGYYVGMLVEPRIGGAVRRHVLLNFGRTADSAEPLALWLEMPPGSLTWLCTERLDDAVAVAGTDTVVSTTAHIVTASAWRCIVALLRNEECAVHVCGMNSTVTAHTHTGASGRTHVYGLYKNADKPLIPFIAPRAGADAWPHIIRAGGEWPQ